MFQSIADYPVRPNGAPIKEVVEMSSSIRSRTSLAMFEVRRMKGADVLAKIA